jgi:hypothetical protein
VLRDTAQLMIDELASAKDTLDPQAMRQALRRGLRWGLTPASDDDPRALAKALYGEPDVPLLAVLTERAAEALTARLAAAPKVKATEPPADAAKAAVNATEPLGRAIAELANPEGLMAILSRIDTEQLLRLSRLDSGTADATLEDEWLTVVAAVRPRLAGLEALQLEASAGGFPALSAWTNSPGDPWQKAALAALRARREQPGGNDPSLAMPRLVTAFTTGAVWQQPTVAVGLIDGWSEAVPRKAQTTTAVFGFNAPGARAPQAILLAVPPDLTTGYGAELDTAGLIQILGETRQLAHARAAEPEHLGGYLAAMPTMMFHAGSHTSVRLDPTTTFPR